MRALPDGTNEWLVWELPGGRTLRPDTEYTDHHGTRHVFKRVWEQNGRPIVQGFKVVGGAPTARHPDEIRTVHRSKQATT